MLANSALAATMFVRAKATGACMDRWAFCGDEMFYFMFEGCLCEYRHGYLTAVCCTGCL